jgi:hypothetical protein
MELMARWISDDRNNRFAIGARDFLLDEREHLL